MFEDLDELARGLATGSISRRKAIMWASYGVLGAALSSMGFAEPAEALTRRFRRRCRRKGGTPVEKGNCHCALNCGVDPSDFICHSNLDCICYQTTDGRAICALDPSQCNNCTTSADCPTGQKCVVKSCCPNQGICAAPCPT
jgi:hypothetical protein